jgi:hypothetical protein
MMHWSRAILKIAPACPDQCIIKHQVFFQCMKLPARLAQSAQKHAIINVSGASMAFIGLIAISPSPLVRSFFFFKRHIALNLN